MAGGVCGQAACVIGKLGCMDGELGCRDTPCALVVDADGADVAKGFADILGASVTGNANKPFCFAGPCSIAAAADIGSSCLDEPLTLALGDPFEVSDIAGHCTMADGVKGGMNFIRGGCVLISVANGDKSRGIELCAVPTGANGELRRLGFGVMVTGVVEVLSSAERRPPSLELDLSGELINGE